MGLPWPRGGDWVRLQVLRDTADGFVVAQKDLELRGPGEVLGKRQTGVLQLRVADLVRDALDDYNPLTAFAELEPTKVLFVCDGRPYRQVKDALLANQCDRGVREIVMLFERPSVMPSAADTRGGLYMT